MEIMIMIIKLKCQLGKLVVVINIVLVGFIINKFYCNQYCINVGYELINCMLNRGIKEKVSVIISDNVFNMIVVIEVVGVQKLGCLVVVFNKVLFFLLLQRVFVNVRLVDIFFYKSNIVIEVF